MTPTLSPQQREEVLELLARAYDKEDAAQRGEEDPWIVEDIEGDTEAERAWQADRKACAAQALDAALPAIIGAVLERAIVVVDRVDDVVLAVEALRALAEEVR